MRHSVRLLWQRQKVCMVSLTSRSCIDPTTPVALQPKSNQGYDRWTHAYLPAVRGPSVWNRRWGHYNSRCCASASVLPQGSGLRPHATQQRCPTPTSAADCLPSKYVQIMHNFYASLNYISYATVVMYTDSENNWFQSGHIWGNALVKAPERVAATGWGWRQDRPDSCPDPMYISLPIISRKLPELGICGCSSVCKRICKCFRAQQPCTTLCGCKGICPPDN